MIEATREQKEEQARYCRQLGWPISKIVREVKLSKFHVYRALGQDPNRSRKPESIQQRIREQSQEVKEAAAPAPVVEVVDGLDRDLLKLLKRGQAEYTVEGLADRFEVAPRRIREAIEKLQGEHYLASVADSGRVALAREPERRSGSVIRTDAFFGKTIRFGALGDTHLCSRYERLDVLNTLYDIYAREGITTVYHTGNYIDGEARFNQNDLKVHGLGNQVRYFLDYYPQRDGIDTYYVAGDDHEGWWVQRDGIDIGRYTEDVARRSGREDLHYLGYMEHDITLEAAPGGPEAILRVVHAGGGSAYAISYTTQKLIESLSGGEKPAIMLIGHYHKAEYLHYRNIHAIQTGTTCDQTPFMRKKRLSAHVGGWIVEANQAPDGSINRFKVEWVSFFNQEFYEKNWVYQMEAA